MEIKYTWKNKMIAFGGSVEYFYAGIHKVASVTYDGMKPKGSKLSWKAIVILPSSNNKTIESFETLEEAKLHAEYLTKQWVEGLIKCYH